MPITAKHEDLHGNAPDEADAALLLIDVINDLEQMKTVLKANIMPSTDLDLVEINSSHSFEG